MEETLDVSHKFPTRIEGRDKHFAKVNYFSSPLPSKIVTETNFSHGFEVQNLSFSVMCLILLGLRIKKTF